MSASLDELLGSCTSCACGRRHEVPTRDVLLGPGVLSALPELVTRHAGGRQGALIADATTWEVAGQEARRNLAGFRVREVILQASAGQASVSADEAALARLHKRLGGDLGFLVCVGSGTLNDLTKLAATALGVPSVCVATAPSMNGYPSTIAAILRGGIKRTEPCEAPVAILGDTDILSRAPREMIQAGFGDLLSKGTSSADWLLAHQVTGEYFCMRPVEVVKEAEEACVREAAAIGRGEAAAVELLMRGLLQSGISMAMAGSSSPASGGEHLISHYWDMTAHARRRRPDLHGRQVGVATLATARLYEHLREQTRAGLDLAEAVRRRPDSERLKRESEGHFAPLVGQQAAEEISEIAVGKQLAMTRAKTLLDHLREEPETFWAPLFALMRPADELAAALRTADAPTGVEELGVAEQEMHDALVYARHIRERFTVLDLAAELGCVV